VTGFSPSSSGKGGGSGGIGAVLFDTTLGADTASIDTGANGIAQTQNVLEVFILARTDEAVPNSRVAITLNNDSSAIYDWAQVVGSNVTASANNSPAATFWSLICTGSTQPAGCYSPVHVTIPAYTQTTVQKCANALVSSVGTASANMTVVAYGLNYRSTAAISRMKIANNGGTVLKAGSRLLITGR
jgi:hypothetical protein